MNSLVATSGVIRAGARDRQEPLDQRRALRPGRRVDLDPALGHHQVGCRHQDGAGEAVGPTERREHGGGGGSLADVDLGAGHGAEVVGEVPADVDLGIGRRHGARGHDAEEARGHLVAGDEAPGIGAGDDGADGGHGTGVQHRRLARQPVAVGRGDAVGARTTCTVPPRTRKSR